MRCVTKTMQTRTRGRRAAVCRNRIPGAARMVLPSGSLCEYPPGPQPLFNIYLIRCVSTTAAAPQYARTDVLHHAHRLFLCSAPVLAQCETVPTLPRFSWVPPSTLKACPPPASGGVTTLAPLCGESALAPRVAPPHVAIPAVCRVPFRCGSMLWSLCFGCRLLFCRWGVRLRRLCS